jgi:hypothetical protein
MLPTARTCWFLTASLLCFAYGGCCLVLSGEIRERAASLPRMTCHELVRNGPGKYRFIQLTDVQLCSRGHAFYRDMDAAMQMVIPIHSRQEKEPAPADLALLLDIHDDRDRESLLADPDVGKLNCQVDRGIADIDPGFVEYLQTRYPGLRKANLRLVSVGLHEPTEIKSVRTWWHGIVASLVAAAILGWLVGQRLIYSGQPPSALGIGAQDEFSRTFDDRAG